MNRAVAYMGPRPGMAGRHHISSLAQTLRPDDWLKTSERLPDLLWFGKSLTTRRVTSFQSSGPFKQGQEGESGRENHGDGVDSAGSLSSPKFPVLWFRRSIRMI